MLICPNALGSIIKRDQITFNEQNLRGASMYTVAMHVKGEGVTITLFNLMTYIIQTNVWQILETQQQG